MRQALNYFERFLAGRKLLLSVAVAGSKAIIDQSYDVPALTKWVDLVNLMSYDYNLFKWYSPVTGHNSPLFRSWRELGYFGTLNTAWSAYYWHQMGVPKSKLMIGIPTYARVFRLLIPRLKGPGAPALADLGDKSYGEVCRFLKQAGSHEWFDRQAMVPYATNNDTWISYEDRRSVDAKMTWITSEGFGGVMTFSLNADDYKGDCEGESSFALHKQILRNLGL